MHGFSSGSIVAAFDLGQYLLLILTALAVFAVMALRGQPRVVAASGELIEQTGSAIVRQLGLQLAGIEGVTASLAHLSEVLPLDETLYLNTLPNVIDNQGDKAIAGGGVWPEPNAFAEGVTRRSFSGPAVVMDAWRTRMITTLPAVRAIKTMRGTPGDATVLQGAACGRRPIRMQ